MKYEALLAYDVPNYATVTFESESGEAAAARCLQILAEKPNDIAFEEEFASCNGERIVSLSSETGGIVLCDIELDPDPLRDNAFTLLMAAKEAEEAGAAGRHPPAPRWRRLALVRQAQGNHCGVRSGIRRCVGSALMTFFAFI